MSKEEFKEAEPIKYASVSDRFFASGIDLGLLYFIVVPVSLWIFPLVFPNGDIIEQAYAMAISKQPELAQDSEQILEFIYTMHPEIFSDMMSQYVTKIFIQVALIGAFIIPFIYFKSATPGKMIVGIRVVDSITYERISFFQSIIRFLSYIPAAGFIGIGIFWANFNKRKRGWHDYLADTVVILDENRWYKRIWNKIIGK